MHNLKAILYNEKISSYCLINNIVYKGADFYHANKMCFNNRS